MIPPLTFPAWRPVLSANQLSPALNLKAPHGDGS